ncbi:hypothetical protein [Oricola sp.]|uniref:hypothetical protein n=1 Tax=Oricola sp. TaxID=1979950 RepID=UPI003BAB0DEE
MPRPCARSDLMASQVPSPGLVGSQLSGEIVRRQPNAEHGVVIAGVKIGQAGLGVMAFADPRLAGGKARVGRLAIGPAGGRLAAGVPPARNHLLRQGVA